MASVAAAAAAAFAVPVAAQSADSERVIVTGGVAEQRVFDAPFAIGVVDAGTLRSAGPGVNLSEAAVRIPGLVANLRNNYAQDLQISSRGFGARASFGVRGIRLYTDGIPAAGPDGQGQVSHFDLAGAERIEVLRGPFSALYGNGSGGVIALVSAPARERSVTLDADAGSNDLRQARLTLQAPLDGGFDLRASAARFATDGPRPQSAAERGLVNLRLGWQGGADRVVALFNHLEQPAQDPLGLRRDQFDADPGQTAPEALRFDTRKNTRQAQGGVQWQRRLDAAAGLQRLALVAYGGRRRVTQWQAIEPATQTASVNHPGGVIDFDRDYAGLDARLFWRWDGLRMVTGAAHDAQREDRRGYENFTGSGADRQLGVTGSPRRDEVNRTRGSDVFAQADVDLGPTLAATAGLRHGRVTIRSSDRFLSNGDQSGALAFEHTLPALSLRWQPREDLSLYASGGRGQESPTLNELAYRPDGAPGFNDALQAQTSRQVELGLKWRGAAVSVDVALFRADTRDEIGVVSNSGGRSTFRNVGRTRRDGVEIGLEARLAREWLVRAAASVLDARYRDGFRTCAGVPCTNPTVDVPAGNRIAGTLPQHGFVEAVWSPGALEFGLEARGQGRQPVNDANADFAGGHGLLALRALWRVPLGPGRLELLGRVDNLVDRRVAGSVIVNEGNRRFFEPAAGRTLLVSARWVQPY